jgi:hypothetical protein
MANKGVGFHVAYYKTFWYHWREAGPLIDAHRLRIPGSPHPYGKQQEGYAIFSI